ncbi:MAG: SUMF1/EgtB/PvdO family nonheme iron enzyme [Phycisphaerales bacterium]
MIGAPNAVAQSIFEPIPHPPSPVFNAQDIAAVDAITQRFGLDFVTVGAPGNRSWLPSERNLPNFSSPNHIDDRGRVDYAYRVMRTEVVQDQYVEYVRAFRPLWLSMASLPGRVETGSPVDRSFTGSGISILGGFDVNPAYNNSAVTISWRNAARYANWLHNGAPLAGTPEAADWATYMTGAYTFTEQSFTENSLGTPVTRNADARFWLPSLDEYLKAGYYDPNRYEEGAPGGEEGYWRYPDTGNEPPVFGAPGEGEWGYGEDDTFAERLAVGRYPDTQSPWGLLDVVGTAREFVETPWSIVTLPDGSIFVDGRVRVADTFAFPAPLDDWDRTGETSSDYAFRIATFVPSPGAGVVVTFGSLLALKRRR